MTLLFDLDNLHKHYGRFEAIKGITLQMAQGSVGLLGPNGAGKSTLIKTLLGLLEFTGGSAQVLGHRLPGECMAIRRAVGYMPENDCYLPYMSAIHYVSFGGELAGMPRAEAFRRAHEVLYYVGLGEARYRKLKGFSTGMKQRVKLAQALVHGPKLVFLDEPTNGLDPRGRDEMLTLIEDVKRRGVNIVLSSHLLADVERVCEHVIMMNSGQVIYSGSIAEITKESGHTLDIATKDADDALFEALVSKDFDARREGARIKVRLPEGQEGPASTQILQLAADRHIQIRHFMRAELTLEAAFLGLLDKGNEGDEGRAS